MDTKAMENVAPYLSRIADALDRLSPPAAKQADLSVHEGYIWEAKNKVFQAIDSIQRLPLESLKGIQQQRETLMANTRAFAEGRRANNALLWGARGTGKSSILKAIHGALIEEGYNIGLVEIQREDLADLPLVMSILSAAVRPFILFCDDLAFEQDDVSYKSLKAVLEGGLSGRPRNLVFYATSNRRHLMPRQMMENERSSAINPSETTEEKISLSDRFGLWIGFHSVDQETYLDMIAWYVTHYKLPIDLEDAQKQALSWAVGRGNRSGRSAFQFILDLALRLKIDI
ncbi:ATP-binding protein [Alphaproteobacteria bacterium]|nr:ATP-binding protein [Alphaproteobacteria bacterium]